jgi:hypothetical protein
MPEVPQETRLACSDEILAQSNAKQVGGEEVPFAQSLCHLPPALEPASCGFWLERDFECAKNTLGIEYELRRAELTTEGTLYQMRSKALSLWRTNLWTPALLPNELH